MPETAFDEVYENGVLKSRQQRTVSDAEIRARDAEQRLRTGRATLRQIRTQAQSLTTTNAVLTVNQTRQLMQALVTVAQTLMDLELVLAWQPDDGAD